LVFEYLVDVVVARTLPRFIHLAHDFFFENVSGIYFFFPNARVSTRAQPPPLFFFESNEKYTHRRLDSVKKGKSSIFCLLFFDSWNKKHKKKIFLMERRRGDFSMRKRE